MFVMIILCINQQTWGPLVAQTGKVNACHANIVLHSGNSLHKFYTLREFKALRKGNTYHANIVLHNTPHIVALGYPQEQRITELHRRHGCAWTIPLKFEIGMQHAQSAYLCGNALHEVNA